MKKKVKKAIEKQEDEKNVKIGKNRKIIKCKICNRKIIVGGETVSAVCSSCFIRKQLKDFKDGA